MLLLNDKIELIKAYEGVLEIKDSISFLTGDKTDGCESDTAIGRLDLIWNIIYRYSIFHHKDRDMTNKEYRKMERILNDKSMEAWKKAGLIFRKNKDEV